MMGLPCRIAVGCAALLAALPAPLLGARPRLGGGEELGVSLGRVVLALLICLTIAVLAILLVRQRSGKIDLRAWFSRIEIRPRAVQVVESRRLSVNADICLLRHDNREYLLLLLAGDARVLRETEVAAATSEKAPGP